MSYKKTSSTNIEAMQAIPVSYSRQRTSRQPSEKMHQLQMTFSAHD